MSETMVARAIPIDQIVRREDQPREVFDEEGLIELAESIREHGLKQPITVRPLNGQYEIVMGERRWRAHQKLDAATVLAFVEELGDQDAYILALLENLARRDLDPVEEAYGYKKLVEYGKEPQAIAQSMGKTIEHVNGHLEMLGCRVEVLELVRRQHIAPGFARTMARLSANGQAEMLRAMAEDKMTYEELCVLVNAILIRENQGDMFEDVQLTQEQVAAGRKVRSAIDRAVQALIELQDIDPDQAGEALATDQLILKQKVKLLQAGLRKVTAILSRRRVKEYQQNLNGGS